MHLEKFKSNLETATLNTLGISQARVLNALPNHVQYRIQPDSVGQRNDLTEWEHQQRNLRIREASKVLSLAEVVKRLWHDGRIPAFINIFVFKATKNVTILNLFVDSKYIDNDTELELSKDGIEPFHPMLDFPVYMDPNDDSKFDVNWRHKKWQLRYRMWKRKKELKKSIKNVGWWKGME